MTQRRIYQCAFPYFVTFNVLYREWIFDDVYKAELLREIILDTGKLKKHFVYQFCIMPDHVHILCKPNHHNHVAGAGTCSCGDGFERPHSASLCARAVDKPMHKNMHNISDFMYSVKSFFVYQIRKNFGIEYKFLQTRYNFRIVDGDQYLGNVIDYITNNPLKAGLPKKYRQYPYRFKDEDLIARLW